MITNDPSRPGNDEPRRDHVGADRPGDGNAGDRAREQSSGSADMSDTQVTPRFADGYPAPEPAPESAVDRAAHAGTQSGAPTHESGAPSQDTVVLPAGAKLPESAAGESAAAWGAQPYEFSAASGGESGTPPYGQAPFGSAAGASGAPSYDGSGYGSPEYAAAGSGYGGTGYGGTGYGAGGYGGAAYGTAYGSGPYGSAHGSAPYGSAYGNAPYGTPMDEVATPGQPAPRRGRLAGTLASIAAAAILAGGIGGAVGYGLAERQSSTPVTSTTVAASDAALSAPAAGSVAAIAKAVSPSVVQIQAADAQGSGGTGSGFIIRSDGYILTNNHVAAGAGANGKLTVQFADGSSSAATLVGASPSYDLAVLKVDKTGLPAVTLGSSAAVQVGDSAVAIGSPLGLQGTVTSGIISALNRPVTAGGSGETAFIDAIQTDAAINPGNSGGPLVNGAGQVIAINSAIATLGGSAGGQTGSIGLGFAIPIDQAKRIADELISSGTAATPIIGVQIDMQYSDAGARIGAVTAGGPAAQAGLKSGDVVTAVNGTKVQDATAFIVAIRAGKPGDTVELTVNRGGADQTITVTLGSQSAGNG